MTITTPNATLDAVELKADTPTILASVNQIAYDEEAVVSITEPAANTLFFTFNLPVGQPLNIDVTYPTITDMEANTNPTPTGYTPTVFDLAVIQSVEGAENEDNAKLYLCNSVNAGVPTWVFVSDLSGAKGDKGDTGDIGPMPQHQWVGTALQFETEEGVYGDLVELKGDNANDSDIINTSTIGTLNGIDNQKTINEYLYINKVDVNSIGSNLYLYPTTAASDVGGYNRLVDKTTDPDYDATAVDVATGAVNADGQLISSLVADAGLFIGNPGVINITTIGQIRKVGGNANENASFYYEIHKRDSNGDEVLLATSDNTPPIQSDTYQEFFASALLNNGTFLNTDRIVIKYYGDVEEGAGASYEFEFGGNRPVRTLLPVPISVLPLDNKVNKTGDTMTGDLIIDQADFKVEGSAGTAFFVDASAEKAYAGPHEVATLQSFVAGVTDTNTNTALKF